MGTHYILGYQNTAVSEKDKFAYFMWLTNNGVIDKTTITTYFIKFNDVGGIFCVVGFFWC